MVWVNDAEVMPESNPAPATVTVVVPAPVVFTLNENAPVAVMVSASFNAETPFGLPVE